MVQILCTDINRLISSAKYITSRSPDSLELEFYAHKIIFGADIYILVDNNYLYGLNTLY